MDLSLADRLDAIAIRVAVPGIEIAAELKQRSDVTVTFGRGVYGELNDSALERHMGTLARLLYVGWVREYHAALSEPFRQSLIAGPSGQTERDYLTARAELVSAGSSDDGRITIAAKGMQSVVVKVLDGTVQRLSEYELAQRIRQAVSALIRDHLQKISVLKQEFLRP